MLRTGAAKFGTLVSMKGVVFTEFLEMVEALHSADMVDDLIDEAALPSGGAYTSVGTYPFSEMAALVGLLSKKTSTPVPALLQAFGRHLLSRFVVGYPQFFEVEGGAFSFLERLDGYIHVEVRKLYPDAELPRFETERRGDVLVLRYRSERKLADLAEGLLRGAIEHFGEVLTLDREDDPEHGAGKTVFTLRRDAAAT